MKKITVQIEESLIEGNRSNSQEFPESIIEKALKERLDRHCEPKTVNTNIGGLAGKSLQGLMQKVRIKLHV